jgi:hypothetical protein
MLACLVAGIREAPCRCHAIAVLRLRWPDEPFTTRGIITGRSAEGGQTRAEVTVFCEKADGTKIIVANASAVES